MDQDRELTSVIVLNYNGMHNHYLARCIESLSEQTYSHLEIIVVDNASNDDSIKYLQQNFPNIKLVELEKNFGFCGGNNEGYLVSTGNFVMFANNDTVFSSDSIELLVKAAQTAPDIGMASAKLLRPFLDNTQTKRRIDSAGLMLQKDFTLRDRGYFLEDEGQYDEYAYLFAPCGAAAFYRRSALETVAGNGKVWDEDFFAYYEDGDLGWRLQNKGWRCVYVPTAVVEHHRGGSSPSAFFKKPMVFKVHTLKNRYLMLIKNASLSLVLKNLWWFIRQEILIWGYLLLHPKLLFALTKALQKTVPRALRQRRQMQFRSKHSSPFLFKVHPLEVESTRTHYKRK
ncbi:MAG: glycosyltransferase family 2 protein [Anaerolineaceae bacterium]|nr:glycosyltransferase family 2 protein [Anaerolineaceae bacterium]